jgi:hypothetical protein
MTMENGTWCDKVVTRWGHIVYGTLGVTGMLVLLLALLVWEHPVSSEEKEVNEWDTEEFTEAQVEEIQQYLNDLQQREDDNQWNND